MLSFVLSFIKEYAKHLCFINIVSLKCFKVKKGEKIHNKKLNNVIIKTNKLVYQLQNNLF